MEIINEKLFMNCFIIVFIELIQSLNLVVSVFTLVIKITEEFLNTKIGKNNSHLDSFLNI
jgi:hypothetical protein